MLRPWLPQSYTAVIVARSTKPVPPPCRRKPSRIKVPHVLIQSKLFNRGILGYPNNGESNGKENGK